MNLNLLIQMIRRIYDLFTCRYLSVCLQVSIVTFTDKRHIQGTDNQSALTWILVVTLWMSVVEQVLLGGAQDPHHHHCRRSCQELTKTNNTVTHVLEQLAYFFYWQ